MIFASIYCNDCYLVKKITDTATLNIRSVNTAQVIQSSTSHKNMFLVESAVCLFVLWILLTFVFEIVQTFRAIRAQKRLIKNLAARASNNINMANILARGISGDPLSPDGDDLRDIINTGVREMIYRDQKILLRRLRTDSYAERRRIMLKIAKQAYNQSKKIPTSKSVL